MQRLSHLALLLSALSFACSNNDETDTPDSGQQDATTSDSGEHTDAGTAPDSTTPDGGSPDSSAPDSGTTAPTACTYAPPTGNVFYVAPDGNDSTGDGSDGSPWATIAEALLRVPDGSTILVRPGTYNGRIRLRGTFATGVTVRSEVMYAAKLRHDGAVITAYQNNNGCEGITVEGFDIAHSGSGASALVFHIDANGQNDVRRLTVRNNILHDSFNNDILKVNNGISEIVIERNIFFNQEGSDEHIDINSAEGIIVQDNIFFNDFAASGRTNNSDTSSFIVVKDSNEDGDIYQGSENVQIRRNIFLNYEGSSGTVFLLLGEDGKDFYETRNTVVENNLFLGNGTDPMRAAFGVKGGRDVLFQNNTIVGDLPARAFAMRLNREGSNPINENIQFYGNIWSDPTGTMGALNAGDSNDFSDTSPSDVGAFTIGHNLYFNGGASIPTDASERINISDDANAVTADPTLGDQSALVVPHWNGTTFADSSQDSCEAFTRLVTLYGTPQNAVRDAGDANHAPSDDILGRPRSGPPDIGAVELP